MPLRDSDDLSLAYTPAAIDPPPPVMEKPGVHPQPRPPHHRRRHPIRIWLQPFLIGLVIVSAFVSCYVGLMRDPQPHRIPVAVTGSQLANKVQQALGDSIDVRRADSTTEARDALRHRDIVAVLGTGPHGKDLKLDVASANGLSTTTAVTKLVTAYAHGADQHLSVSDVVPLDRYDARGLAGFYVSFGVTLSGFALAQNVVGLSGLLHLRHRFTLMAVFAAASGLVAAAIAGPVLNAVPAPYLPLAFVLALLAAAAAFTTKMLATYVGPLGIPLATLLLLTVGNSTSGATVGADLMPSGARTVSALLPPGAAVRAIADLSYFQSSHVLAPLATLILWAAGSAVLLAFRTTEQRPAAPTPHRATTDDTPIAHRADTEEGHSAPANGTTRHPAFTSSKLSG
ncbi:hypothetical protein OG981_49610 [Streptomyces mirabilis]|uniref:hypothetical protein n=1 Tax=Streptomyces mirabilis TaxID=68239 RepID=UPI002250632E|nr:hypothetical protein [Streptomyces mirabilis]MCX4426355.1 hypothetical protein [Streptomyces mirabilis]